jgi:endonuclease/exonuclease/phosphatase family metal-dependent hydrolase
MSSTNMKIMSYNVLAPVWDKWTTAQHKLLNSDMRFPVIVSNILREHPDIVGLQEVQESFEDYLYENLSDKYFITPMSRNQITSAKYPNGRVMPNGTLSLVSKEFITKTLASNGTCFPENGIANPWLEFADSSGSKDGSAVQILKFYNSSDKKKPVLVVCNLHLEYGHQTEQLRLLNEILKTEYNGASYVLLGDFNEAPNDTETQKGVRSFLSESGFTNVNIKQTNPVITYFNGADELKSRQCDYILTSWSDNSNTLYPECTNLDECLRTYGSDHVPIVSKCEI